MLFAWGDNQAARGNPYWSPRWGLFRENGGYGGDAVAPLDVNDFEHRTDDMGMGSVIMEIRRDVATFCYLHLPDTGTTYLHTMWLASDYLRGRTYTRLQSDWTGYIGGTAGIHDLTMTSIRDRGTPAVGVNQGWADSRVGARNKVWIPDSPSWYSGTIFP